MVDNCNSNNFMPVIDDSDEQSKLLAEKTLPIGVFFGYISEAVNSMAIVMGGNQEHIDEFNGIIKEILSEVDENLCVPIKGLETLLVRGASAKELIDEIESRRKALKDV